MKRFGRVLNVLGAAVVVMGGVVVLVILFRPPVIGHTPAARRLRVFADFEGIDEAIRLFVRDCGFLPPTLDSLVAKKRGTINCPSYDPEGYVDRTPVDPWHNPYVYITDGQAYHLASYGADGKPGGDGEDADVDSRNVEAAWPQNLPR